MFHIAFYVPESHLEQVKENMFNAGAGVLGNYSHCSFESRGIGQFKPLKGSQPFVGKTDKIEKVNEVKVEMICQKQSLVSVISALKEVHPYETPAFYVIETIDTEALV